MKPTGTPKQREADNIHVRCESELWKRARKAAIDRGISAQALVRAALEAYLGKKSEEKKAS